MGHLGFFSVDLRLDDLSRAASASHDAPRTFSRDFPTSVCCPHCRMSSGSRRGLNDLTVSVHGFCEIVKKPLRARLSARATESGNDSEILKQITRSGLGQQFLANRGQMSRHANPLSDPLSQQYPLTLCAARSESDSAVPSSTERHPPSLLPSCSPPSPNT